MIQELIQKMQELAAADGNYNYQVIKIEDSQRNDENIMATFDCRVMTMPNKLTVCLTPILN